MKKVFWIATVVVLFSIQPGCNSNSEPAPGVTAQATQSSEHEMELAVYMGRMQLYMNKLFFAGTVQNADLRDFYIHELEEAMEEIAEAKVIDDGVDISQNIEMFGLAQLEVFEKAIAENPTQFTESYNAFVNSCNSCHVASKYPFIIIKEPTNPVFDNQVYEVN